MDERHYDVRTLQGKFETSMEFAAELERLEAELKRSGRRFECRKSGPASSDDIAKCERSIDKVLPRDFCEFLRFSDGAVLYMDLDDGLYQEIYILGTKVIVVEQAALASFYAECDRYGDVIWPEVGAVEARGHFWTDLIVFAKQSASVCIFDLNPEDGPQNLVLDLDPEDSRGMRDRRIAQSFDDWFNRVVSFARTHHEFVYWLP